MLTRLTSSQRAAAARVAARSMSKPGGEVDDAGEQNDPDEPGVPRHVEEPTGHQQEAKLVRACVQQVVDQQHDRQEDEEIPGGEAHAPASSVLAQPLAHPRHAAGVQVHQVGEVTVAQADGRHGGRRAAEASRRCAISPSARR